MLFPGCKYAFLREALPPWRIGARGAQAPTREPACRRCNVAASGAGPRHERPLRRFCFLRRSPLLREAHRRTGKAKPTASSLASCRSPESVTPPAWRIRAGGAATKQKTPQRFQAPKGRCCRGGHSPRPECLHAGHPLLDRAESASERREESCGSMTVGQAVTAVAKRLTAPA